MSLVYLTEPTLGQLDLGPIVTNGGLRECNADGYVVTGWEVGFPVVREVVRNRALANGSIDDSRFLGPRVVSFSLVIDVNKADPQATIDKLMPYLSPRYRPRLHWTIPGSTQERSLLVRGADAPLLIAGRQAHAVTAQWVGVLGVVESSDRTCEVVNPGSDTEDGRTYDLTFDRTYPFSLGIGDRLVVNDGTAIADWTATIFGPVTDPSIIVNGTAMSFTRNGGLVVTAGTSLVINSRERTVLLNGDPLESRYSNVNFTEWAWDDLRLLPGNNVVRYEGAVLGTGTQVEFCWRSAWL